MHLLDLLASAVAVIGVAVILWGTTLTGFRFLVSEFRNVGRPTEFEEAEFIRHGFGAYLLLGLEFMVAADIIKTIVHPQLEGLLVLGGIVIIRTILSYFLNRELSHYDFHRRQMPSED